MQGWGSGTNQNGGCSLKMSRIGKKPIKIPEEVKVDIKDLTVTVEGPKGKLTYNLPTRRIEIIKTGDDTLKLINTSNSNRENAYYGLARSIINNMISGVVSGYSKILEIEGMGFKAASDGKTLTLRLGYSHPIKYNIPENVNVKTTQDNKIIIEGIDKAEVGEVAAVIRSFYKPEVYKGKGVRYQGEMIRRKTGKQVA